MKHIFKLTINGMEELAEVLEYVRGNIQTEIQIAPHSLGFLYFSHLHLLLWLNTSLLPTLLIYCILPLN